MLNRRIYRVIVITIFLLIIIGILPVYTAANTINPNYADVNSFVKTEYNKSHEAHRWIKGIISDDVSKGKDLAADIKQLVNSQLELSRNLPEELEKLIQKEIKRSKGLGRETTKIYERMRDNVRQIPRDLRFIQRALELD